MCIGKLNRIGKRPIILGVLGAGLLFFGMFALLPEQWSLIGIRFVWGADASGNDICWSQVFQNNGTAFVELVNWTSSGGTQRINAGLEIRFVVQCKFNNTLVASTAEAVTYSNLTMNITYNAGASYVWTEQPLNNTASVLSGSFYLVTWSGDWNSTLPVAGTTYNCTQKAWFSY